MSLSLDQKARLFTPIACRLLARRRGNGRSTVAMTDREIQQASGLPMSVIKHLSWSVSWDEIEWRHMRAFTKATGVSFDDRASVRRNARYLREGNWSHILRSPEAKTFYRDLYKEWQRARGKVK